MLVSYIDGYMIESHLDHIFSLLLAIVIAVFRVSEIFYLNLEYTTKFDI
jgi:hypothetical protein